MRNKYIVCSEKNTGGRRQEQIVPPPETFFEKILEFLENQSPLRSNLMYAQNAVQLSRVMYSHRVV